MNAVLFLIMCIQQIGIDHINLINTVIQCGLLNTAWELKGLMDKRVKVKFDMGCLLTVGMVTCYIDRPRCSGSFLVTVTLEQRSICKSTTVLTTICSASDGYCVFFFSTRPSLSLLVRSLFFLNKSFPSLNPVRIENCCYHVGCFSGSECDVCESKAMSE